LNFMNTPLMSQAEYARHRGVSAPAVSNWKKAGHLVFAEDPQRPGSHRIDVARTDARLNSKLDPTRGRPTTGTPPAAVQQPEGGDLLSGGGRSQAQVRIDLAQEQLIGQRLKNAREARELAPAVELERRAAELGRVARERMQAMFRSISERLAAEHNVRAIMAIGSGEIDRVFSELADDVDQGILTTGDDDPVDAVAIENELEALPTED
jgi:hypothetical protein